MLKNYFKLAWRNLLKNKVYSFINIIGLATGMAIALLIGVWIWDELSFNKSYPNHERIASVMVEQTFNGETGSGDGIVVPMEQELRTKYASDFKRLSLIWSSTNILAVGDKKISRSGLSVQADFPEMLSLQMISGNRTGIADPSSILLSHSVATALFGNSDPINRIIKADNSVELKVAGVYEDIPRNSTYDQAKFLLPWTMPANDWNKSTDWDNHGPRMIVQLNEEVELAKVSAKIKGIIKKHFPQSTDNAFLYPMDRWHLYYDLNNGKVDQGRIQFVWLFGIIGSFVLLLACINFMNLSTARSEKRAKEVGIRKSVGSLRGQLIAQFLSESLVVALLALIFALGLLILSLPFFNHIADKQMSIPWNKPAFWLMILGFTFFTGLISGSYPAFYLSSFEPVKVLKGVFRAGRFASLPRKILVVLQFTVSISLIIGTIIVLQQIQYAKSRPVGYTREGLITIDMNTPEFYAHYNALRNELIQTGAAENMGESNSASTEIWSNNSGFNWEGKDPHTDPLFGTIAVTHDFGKTIGWKVVEGRDFSREFPSDSGAFILNQSAVKLAGIKNPVGKKMFWNGKDHLVIGVIKDMVMNSPYKSAVATVFHMEYGWVHLITLRIKPNMPVRTALAKIEAVFKKFNPGSPFIYKFTDEEYANKFSDEEKIGNLAGIFAGLAIFISCLGLFGLASFVAEQRTKEIGVRKVLGATVFNLWKLLSADFTLLVLLSCLIATPLSWYFLNQWLQGYDYRTAISWWIFIVAGCTALIITLLTVSYQSIRAALKNPVSSLRTE